MAIYIVAVLYGELPNPSATPHFTNSFMLSACPIPRSRRVTVLHANRDETSLVPLAVFYSISAAFIFPICKSTAASFTT